VRKVTQIYAARRNAFAATLAAELGGVADFDVPDGGLAFWLRFRDLDILDRIEVGASAQRLWLAPSRSFVTRPDAVRGLRLGFASLTEAEAQDGIRRLQKASSV
jgi:GntR family transcriptional regulator/MocR family aminotransferase